MAWMTPLVRGTRIMNEIAFQFIPLEDISDINHHNFATESFEKTSNKQGGVKSIRLDETRWLEFSNMGSMSFIVETDLNPQINLNNLFELAKKHLQRFSNIDVSDYTLCILISSENPARRYLEYKENT